MRRADCDDELLIQICERFLYEKQGPTQIAEWLRKERGLEVNREQIYPLIREAAERQFLRLHPPIHTALQRRVRDRYRLDSDNVHVIGHSERQYLAMAAAAKVVELIREVSYASRKTVRIGFGGGGTAMLVARELAPLLSRESHLPRLALHALSSGFEETNPRSAPISFFGYFDKAVQDIDYVALFAPAIVPFGHYERVKSQPGVMESFKWVDEIDIVITSLAGADDEHGDLNRFMELDQVAGGHSVTELRDKNWCGDVGYRPYSPTGPIDAVGGSRSVSLFELHHLVELAQREDKHVVLVAAPCGRCEKTKELALRPLLTEPRLRLWTHLFMDMKTAQSLLPQGGDRPEAA